MDIVGYADRLSAAPGDVVRFMVSTIAPRYEASIVRLIHGDTQQPGPGYKDEPTPSTVDGQYVGREQAIHIGSHVVVADTPALRLNGSLALHADVVYFEAPQGGAVFAVGSITWCGCLSQDNYNNNVSRMTENVLRRFLLPP